MAQLKSIRLRLDKPLTGPYDRLLRRPGPEVIALAAGETMAIIRGTRLLKAMPLWESAAACYYAPNKADTGWSPEDFSNAQQADHWVEKGLVNSLAMPIGYFKVPNAAWVSALAVELTPWTAQAVEAWRAGIERDIWLTVLRVYRCAPVQPKFLRQTGLHLRVRPFAVEQLQPVVLESELEWRMEQIQEAVERHARGGSTRAGASYDVQAFTAETGYSADQLKGWIDQLQRKQQLILYGPPGTGKTYLAERLARYLVDGGVSELVQFHASYAYEDFVQGIRPQVVEGALHYELAAGHFRRFCAKARRVGEKPCVLIIDEINRANLARVFGELMYLLEYRHRSIALAAGGPEFSIPANVYLIGTMNTADRSIALVDQAMRRRFSFIRLRPNYQLLANYLDNRGVPPKKLVPLLKEVNQSIGDEDCELGISFFMVADIATALAHIWQGEVEPYLEEVFFDRPDQMARFRWSKVAERLQD
ncbi:MAG: AAA domain-containing protein [Acidimicrobiaceae bacterium]|nr:AAA domain-containing protein [Acidimicrobiaceae bacterium]